MKLSKETIAVLSATTQINDGVVISPGNEIQVESEAGDIFMKAKVDESFEKEIVFSRTGGFLSTLKLFDEPEITFNDNYCLIESGNNKCRYYYGHANLISHGHWHDITSDNAAISFSLSSDDIKTITKATSVLDLNQIEFSNKDGKIVCNILDRETNSVTDNSQLSGSANNNSYSIELGDCNPDLDFSVVLRDDIFNVFPGDYDFHIVVGKFIVVLAENKSFDVAYQIAANRASFFNE